MEKILQQLDEIENELSQDRQDPEIWNDHGVGLHLLGRYQKAVESFRSAIQLKQDHPTYHFNLANSYMELGEIEKAIDSFLTALDHNPNHIPSLNNLADAYELAGQADQAHELFHYLTCIQPDDPLSHFNLGNFLLRQNQHIEAAKCYEKTIELDESFIDAYFNIAWILKRVRAIPESISYAKKGLALDPGHKDLQELINELNSTAD
ncbi:MAG: tetratricopeptide repeat protein [Balneolaceae bacterium]